MLRTEIAASKTFPYVGRTWPHNLLKGCGNGNGIPYQRLTPALNAVYGNIREAEQRLGPVEDIKEVFEQAQQALYMAEAG